MLGSLFFPLAKKAYRIKEVTKWTTIYLNALYATSPPLFPFYSSRHDVGIFVLKSVGAWDDGKKKELFGIFG